MHFIAVGVLVFSILFSNTSYTQDVQDLTIETDLVKIDTRGMEQDEKTKKDKKVEQKEFVFTPLSGGNPLAFTTFRPYNAQTDINSGIMEWKNRYQKPQKKYNVSLVGVNIYSWLENPEYFNVLKEMSKKIPLRSLLENLQANNPNLVFNSPDVVRKALNSDIYTPYLKGISNYTDKNIRFSDVKEVISYTRRYHIYGVTAGGLPYFGRPMEGGKREINLGILAGQIDEVAVKLPDTDIFLVAMINITPNWLEEGMNILHKSQQELEILVYAFDRRGKLLGGAGIPMDFVHKGQYFEMEQKIRSKFWQAGVSRAFYLWPSFRMLNDKKEGQARVAPNITLPQDKSPTLNRKQKYILASIKDLRASNKNLSVELFDSTGEHVFSPKRVKETNKVVLANRIILHKESKLLVQDKKFNISELVTYNIMGRFQNMANEEKEDKEDDKIGTSEKTILTKKHYPSNEGEKLVSLLQYGKEMLVSSPITHTNELHYTNVVIPYQLEADPLLYAKGRKKYVFLPNNLKVLTKDFKKKDKKIFNQVKRKNKDRVFWNNFTIKRLDDQELSTQEMKDALKKWKKIYSSLEKIEYKIYKIDRQKLLYTEQEKMFAELKQRNIQFLNLKYARKTNTLSKKIAKLDVKADKISNKIVLKLNNKKDIEHRTLLQQEYEDISVQEQEAFNEMIVLLPTSVNYMKNIKNDEATFVNITDIALTKDKDIKAIAKLNGIDPELVAVARSLKKYSPMQKYNNKKAKEVLKAEKKALKVQKRKEKRLYFEGFSLGLTRAWKTKTTLSDRLDYL